MDILNMHIAYYLTVITNVNVAMKLQLKYTYFNIITLLQFFIEMLQYDWLWSGYMIIKVMFHIPIRTCTCLHDDVGCKQSMA
jgi:hypothetical protein